MSSSSCISICEKPVLDRCKDSYGKTIQGFILQGNAIDLAIGLVIGTAFAKIVTSIIEDLVMPAILCIFGDFTLRDSFKVCRKRKYDSIQELEASGAVPVGLYPDLDAAVAAGVNIFIQVDSLEQAQEIGLNTINWGNFIQILINFIIIVLIISSLIFAIQKIRCSVAVAKKKK